MAQDKNVNTQTTSDETGYINTEELRDVLKEEEETKKVCWIKRIFSKKKTKTDKKDKK